MKKIIILGGGFAGVRAALDLARSRLPETKIVLLSNTPHFEYHAALYRVVTGRSPLEVCVPLAEIFRDLPVEILQDRVNKVDLAGKLLTSESGSRYTYDYLVLAVGSETSYFGISGLPEFSFGLKSISEALRLRNHLHQVFESCARGESEDKVCGSHVVIVGGGATGVELAGELAAYSRVLARRHNLDPYLITIDLIEAAPRLLPALSLSVSARVKQRLHDLGVNVFLNRTLVREEVGSIELKDMIIQAKTIIWTAGVKNNRLLAGIAGLTFDKKGRVVVDGHLRPAGYSDVFVVGDSASVPDAGLAWSAVRMGTHAARVLSANLSGRALPSIYQAATPTSSIPVGPGWAASLFGPVSLYGYIGWLVRRLIDCKFFLSILPLRRALVAFDPHQRLSESCPICNPTGQVEFK